MSAPLNAVRALRLHQNSPAETNSGFDYGQLSDADATLTATIAERIRRRHRNFQVDTGRELQQVKDRLDHGLFGAWLKAEFDMKERTAQNYMAAARLVERTSATVADLPPAALYVLAAPSTPEAAQDAIVRRLEAGERVEADAVMAVVREAKEEQRQAKAEARQTPEQRQQETDRKRQSAAAKARHEERQHRKWAQERDDRRARAHLAARYLVEHLGDDVQVFHGLMTRASWHEVAEEVAAIMRSGSVFQVQP